MAWKGPIRNIPSVKNRKATPVCATGTPRRSPISMESTGNNTYKDINNSKLAIHIRIKCTVHNFTAIYYFNIVPSRWGSRNSSRRTHNG